MATLRLGLLTRSGIPISARAEFFFPKGARIV
jgi:hypothetical protein